jgi:hypothetical protein
MTFQTPKCPQCGQKAIGVLETCTALALLNFRDHFTATYTGEARHNEDRETLFTNGLVTLECINGHQWLSGMDTD